MNNILWPYANSVNLEIYESRTNWPKISIVTPSYNQGQFIEETILSVLNQNYPNLEYIIIDGGSTDDTVEIIKKYEDRITYWVSEKDRGQSHAINKGFDKATGEIFAYINSDDCYYPTALQLVAFNYLSKDKVKNYVFVGNCAWGKNLNDTTNFIDKPNFPRDIVSSLNKKYLASQPSIFWTKRNTKLYFNEALQFCMDFEFWLQLLKNNYTLSSIDQTLSFFRDHNESKSNNLYELLANELIGVTYLYLKEVPRHNLSDLKLEIINKEMVNINQEILENLKLKSTVGKIRYLKNIKLIRVIKLTLFLRSLFKW